MSLIKVGKYWRFDFWFRKTRYQGATGCTNKNAAKLVESAKRQEAALQFAGIIPAKQSPLLAEYLNAKFLEHCRQHAKARKTAIFYGHRVKMLLQWPKWAEMRLSAITGDVINEYIAFRSKTVGINTLNAELATLRKALRLAEEWKLAPKIKVRLLPGAPRRDFVVSAQLEAEYLAAAAYPLKQAAILILDLGLRPEETVFLRKSDICQDCIEVSRSKTNNGVRTLPLTERSKQSLEILSALHPSSEWLFPGRKGRHLTADYLSKLHGQLWAKHDWPDGFVLYSFRHSFGTQLAESGASPYDIMRLMGHASIRMSERYVHPQSDTLSLAMRRKEELAKLKRGETVPVDFISTESSITKQRT